VVPERVVTISSSYGAGGSVVGPAVAEALGVPFLDRVVPARLASGSQLRPGEEAAAEERTSSLLERIVASFANLPDAFGPGAPPSPQPSPPGASDEELRKETEQRVRAFVAEHGAGVILGWGATVLLADAFHVRLGGPLQRRVEQAMRIEGVDRSEAERRQADTDRVRGQYLRRVHGRDWNSLDLYHLSLDSTCMPLDAATALVVSAAKSFFAARQPAPH
jgi:cytidylate kinase